MIAEFLNKYQLNQVQRIGVAVSGGADSLALVLMMQEELAPLGKKIIALTVDHKLRPESKDEALYVGRIMKAYKIEHHILTWDGTKPKNGIEEAAREARYNLLANWCKNNDVQVLAVAHQALDQAETFFMRLQRGSGLDGLCGMRPLTSRQGLTIIRPLLSIMPEDLKKYLYNHKIEWVEDPSNQCDDFLRVRVRKFMPQLQENLGISVQRMVETMATLQTTLDYLQNRVGQFIKNHVRVWDNAGYSFSVKNLAFMHEELLFRVLSSLIWNMGKANYKPESSEIKRLMWRLSEDDFKSCTLGGCEIIKQYEQIWIVPELKLKKLPSKQDWDKFTEMHPKYKKLKIPHKLRLSLQKLVPIYR